MLLRAGARTGRVVAAGLNKAMLWGSSVLGCSDGQLRRARQIAARGVSAAVRGGSTTAKLMLCEPRSRGADPAFQAHRGPLEHWAFGVCDAVAAASGDPITLHGLGL